MKSPNKFSELDCYYKVLGLQKNANKSQIYKAYKKCAKEVHPVNLQLLFYFKIRINALTIRKKLICAFTKSMTPIIFYLMTLKEVFTIRLGVTAWILRECSTGLRK